MFVYRAQLVHFYQKFYGLGCSCTHPTLQEMSSLSFLRMQVLCLSSFKKPHAGWRGRSDLTSLSAPAGEYENTLRNQREKKTQLNSGNAAAKIGYDIAWDE